MINQILLYISHSHDPYLNLAIEEYLTMHTKDNECILYLWQNEKTVVIGKNQNCWQECHVTKFIQDGGRICRRLSGGGCVYHDLGNLNFTFCSQKVNYHLDKQLNTILNAVQLLGIDAIKTGRNDITTNGKKFSGNAFYEHHGHCYHHGTIMVNVDVDTMVKYLNVDPDKLKSNGVHSINSRVINLKSIIHDITVDDLMKAFIKSFEMNYQLKVNHIHDEDLNWDDIHQLRDKYLSWDWIYGKKINFQHQFKKRYKWGYIEFLFEVESGKINNVKIYSDALDSRFIDDISHAMIGCHYDLNELKESLNILNLDRDKLNDILLLFDESI